MSTALVGNRFSSIPLKIAFHIKNKICHQRLVTAQNLQTIQTFLTLAWELSQYCKSGSTLSPSEPVEDSSDCRWLGNNLSCARQSNPPKPCQSAAQRALRLPLILLKIFDCLLESSLGVIARLQARAQTWTQTGSLPTDQRDVNVNSWLHCVEFVFKFFSGLLNTLKLRTGVSRLQPTSPRLGAAKIATGKF